MTKSSVTPAKVAKGFALGLGGVAASVLLYAVVVGTVDWLVEEKLRGRTS